MFDVFYFGPKPNLFEFEKYAGSIEDAAAQCKTGHYWYIYGGNDYTGFDFRFVPAPWESHYTHVWANQWQKDGNVYLTSNPAAEMRYHEQAVHRLPDPGCLSIPDYIDPASVDMRWAPDPLDPPYIYHFPSQHQSACGVTYTVAGATEPKLVSPFVCTAMYNIQPWTTVIPVAGFDYTWHPNVLDPAYRYVFGNQWNPAEIEPTVIYTVAGATEDKFMHETTAQVIADLNGWQVLDAIAEFDFSWRPNPKDPAYIYIFGNQWLTPEQRPALKFAVAGATEIKYMDYPKAKRQATKDKFTVHYFCDFDYSWEPDPGSPPYNYVFGNQWYPPEVMPTVEYHMAGATEVKYIDHVKAKLHDRHDNHWHTLIDCEWDYSWRPEPGSPAYIFVFGNQHHSAVKMPTVEYHMAGATERKYMDYPAAGLLADESRWSVPEEVNKDNIDFTWVPDPGNPPYIYHFGTDFQDSVNLIYTIPGATEIRFEGAIPKKVKEKSAIEVLDIFFIDRGNDTAAARYERLSKDFNVTKVRYANSMMDTIRRCITRTKTSKFWVISSEYNYDDFDFRWHAQPWQSYMTHVFASQHNKWSDTFLINKYEFERHAKWANGLEQFPNLNFVPDQKVVKPDNIWNMYYVDHGNPESQYELLRDYYDVVKTRFMDNYLDTFKRIMNTATTEYVWILNSVCTYDFFDFTWQPEPWQKEMIHCFVNGSDNTMELRGDTFYIHVESFKAQMVELELLDWFNVINYVVDARVDRWPVPAVHYTGDNLIEAIKNHTFTTPYALFTNDTGVNGIRTVNTCLWTEKDRVARDLSTDKSTSLIPRDIKKYINTQVYDYPYLDVTKTRNVRHTPDLDIIYISNGEPDEQKWFENAEYQSNRNVKWIRGVNGRTAAYQAAARASESDWFFTVFAKLEVLGSEFPWHWQPDYWQGPKHYIFNARNPVNGLEYGHMGMIAYNKSLVLANNDPGIDFTLSQPHTTVPILSGIAHYNQDAWTTWRTAFREVIKLKHFMVTQPTLETEHRLNVWLTVAEGQYSEYSLIGAADAVKYYDSVNGDYERLKLSFEWAWLSHQFKKYV